MTVVVSDGSQLSVSVVVPMFNAEAWIHETLTSIAEQTYPVVECVVVDDGSTDGSARIVEEFAQTSSLPVNLIHGPNRGVSSARNTGIRRSVGEFVAFLDADDLWNPQKIELQVKLIQHSGALACYCAYEIFDSTTRRGKGVVRFHDAQRALRQWLAMEGHGMLLSSTAMVSRVALSQASGFHSDLWTSADLEFAVQVARLGPVIADPLVLVGYRSHGTQMHRVLDELIQNQERLYDTVTPFEGDHLFERRCRANLDAHAGYKLLRNRRYRAGSGRLWGSLQRDPRRVVSLPLFVARRHVGRRLSGLLSRRRFFDPVST